ncbi:hypothetical protein [Lichenibacterium ramalinae]|uniref:Uncharacterized protein n=1 Tax=Lichenibacterium ramalinae TaxID=2316527 RepID=A0A4Q2R9R2_9HYPH|nr:hypothetical protein [Lichenibacterium ramalinae]RYB03425.1 hypothetical protein D3272_16825 [Lichenibacterium ramalinae]
MAVAHRLSNDDIKALADRVLGAEMSDLDFGGVVVSQRDVYDDGPSLFVDARVAGDVPAPFDPKRFEQLRRLLRDALLDHGDERFPHLSLERAGDESPEPDHIPTDA